MPEDTKQVQRSAWPARYVGVMVAFGLAFPLEALVLLSQHSVQKPSQDLVYLFLRGVLWAMVTMIVCCWAVNRAPRALRLVLRTVIVLGMLGDMAWSTMHIHVGYIYGKVDVVVPLAVLVFVILPSALTYWGTRRNAAS